ncbi:MAG: ribonuclease E/G [Zetaproteobacteria bacterium]|nr:ribonuclease E/G [Zetaproteobacteria bacterium]
MLINASHEEESRVAVIEDDYLQELNIESAQKAVTKGNIYRGTITKVEASLQAAFVEYGSARQGFLPLNEIHPDYWKASADKTADSRKMNIQDLVDNKQQILVQVVKEERGNKGAALTTQISLAGRYLVLSPNTNRGGISRKLSDDDRKAMKAILTQLDVPESMGLIVRTAGKDQKLESLERDYMYLRRLWDEIRIKGDTAPAPALIYLEGDLATRAIRDHFTEDIEEIWVDNHETYTRTKQFVHAVIPGKEKIVKLYRGKKPLFRHYNIEGQCEDIHEREVRLPSGGSIVFDPTEALTSVDINSSRSTRGKHIDDTALQTNIEAAREIARQLRIRDIGGLIVIDFIDMASRKHAQQVEEELRNATAYDKARVQVTRISRFGLLEMSRQRLHPSVRETTTEECPRCQGKGSIRTVESMALQMLTRIEDLAAAGKKPTLVVQIPSETGEYLMNNKRDSIARIEEMYEVQVSIQIRPELDIPHYRIERHWNEENQKRMEVLEDTGKNKKPIRPGRKLKALKPVVGVPEIPEITQPTTPAVIKKSWWTLLLETLFGRKEPKVEESSVEENTPTPPPQARKPRSTRNNENRSENRNNRNRNRRASTPKAEDEDTPPSSKNDENLISENLENNPALAEGEAPARRRRRRRRPNKSRETNGETTTDENSTANNSDEISPEKTTVTQAAITTVTEPNAPSSNVASEESSGEQTSEEGSKRKRPRRRRRPRHKGNDDASDNNREIGESADNPAPQIQKEHSANASTANDTSDGASTTAPKKSAAQNGNTPSTTPTAIPSANEVKHSGDENNA